METIWTQLSEIAGRVLWSLGQAVVGVLYPAANPRVERLQRATAILLLASVLCLSIGLGVWHAGVAWSGAWALWLAGGISLFAAGYLGSCVEAACARPAPLARLPFENSTVSDV